MATYNISFRGEALPGHDLSVVKQRFAKAFRLSDPGRVEAFFSGREVFLRRNISLEQAELLQQKLANIGLATRAVPAQAPEPAAARPAPPPASAATSEEAVPAAGSPAHDDAASSSRDAARASAARPPEAASPDAAPVRSSITDALFGGAKSGAPASVRSGEPPGTQMALPIEPPEAQDASTDASGPASTQPPATDPEPPSAPGATATPAAPTEPRERLPEPGQPQRESGETAGGPPAPTIENISVRPAAPASPGGRTGGEPGETASRDTTPDAPRVAGTSETAASTAAEPDASTIGPVATPDAESAPEPASEAATPGPPGFSRLELAIPASPAASDAAARADRSASENPPTHSPAPRTSDDEQRLAQSSAGMAPETRSPGEPRQSSESTAAAETTAVPGIPPGIGQTAARGTNDEPAVRHTAQEFPARHTPDDAFDSVSASTARPDSSQRHALGGEHPAPASSTPPRDDRGANERETASDRAGNRVTDARHRDTPAARSSAAKTPDPGFAPVGSPTAGSSTAGSSTAGSPAAGSPAAGSPAARPSAPASPAGARPGPESITAVKPAAEAPFSARPGTGVPAADTSTAGAPTPAKFIARKPVAGTPAARTPVAGTPAARKPAAPTPNDGKQPASAAVGKNASTPAPAPPADRPSAGARQTPGRSTGTHPATRADGRSGPQVRPPAGAGGEVARTTDAAPKRQPQLTPVARHPASPPARATPGKPAAESRRTPGGSRPTAVARAPLTEAPHPPPLAPGWQNKPPERRQPGAPNLFDLRPSGRAGAARPADASADPLRQAPVVIAGILTLALVLVGLRFWVENLAAPAQGLGAVAVDHRNAPAVIVNDELILHERSGLDIDRLPLRDFGAGHNAAIAFFSNGDLLLWQPPVENPLPAWVSRFMTADTEAPGTLSRCSLDTRDCTLIRDGVESARFIVEPRTDNILLADQGKNRLEKLTPSGERLAVRSMDLTPPVSLALKEGILYLTRGHLNNVSVLKPDTIDFAARLETIDLRLDDLGQSGLIFPTAIAPLGGHWWAVLQSRDATTAGLFRFGPDWQARERVDLPAGAQPAQLAVWAHKLLAPDPRSEVVYRVADDGTVEKLFNEDTLSAALAERRGEIAKTRTMQSLVLLVLSLGAIGLLALGSLRSLQRKVYQPATDASAARFDINDDAIQWLAPAAARDARLRFLGVGMGVLSAALLIGAFIAQLSAPVLLAICLLLVGLGGFYAALQRASACYLGRLGDQLILVDHDNTYRVGHGANIQYLDNFVMIDDVVVFLGNRLLPRFAGEQLKQQFAPLVTRGIKVDRTTLRLKLMSSRHPLLYGVTGFAVCGVFALALLVLA